jgi:hypothetical protein
MATGALGVRRARRERARREPAREHGALQQREHLERTHARRDGRASAISRSPHRTAQLVIGKRHVEPHLLPIGERRVGHERDRERVVHDAPIEVLVFLMKVRIEAKGIGPEARLLIALPRLGQRTNRAPRYRDAPGDVERHEPQVEMRVHHEVRGLGIGPPVEFASLRLRTGHAQGASHHEHGAQRIRDVGREGDRGREIRERTEAADRELAVPSHLRDDRFGRAIDLRLRRLRGDHVAESLGAVRLARGARLAHERRGRAGNDRRGDPSDLRNEPRVPRGAIDIGVAMHRRDGDDAQLRELRCQRERHGVVDPGIGVDENGSGHGP